MHSSVLEQVSQWVLRFNLNRVDTNVLEVGSQNYNGSVRPYFDKTKYTGVDMSDGAGVDVVASSHNLVHEPKLKSLLDKTDVLICTEMLEHDVAFWQTLNQFRYFLKRDGILILTARGVTVGSPGVEGRSMWEHGYPHDYWRFLPQSVPLLFDLASCVILEQKEDHQHPGFMAIGRKLHASK